MDDDAFAKILRYFNLSWSGYRKVRKGVKKRIARHMQSLGVADVDGYLSLVDKVPEIEEECRNLTTVSISRFFRDRRLWEGLEREILPMLPAGLGDGEPLKAWSCGCARGEEAYSFKILWEKTKERSGSLPRLELRATDTNPDYLRMAVEGSYERHSLKEIPESERDKWFEKVPGKQKVKIKPFLKDGVVFEQRDFLRDPPPGRDFRLVFARNNLLTYYRPPERDAALAWIIGSIRKGGVLIIGSHEKIPPEFSSVKRHPEFGWIYMKQID